MDYQISLVQDVWYALRSLRNHPGFTLIAALTLGLGIGGNTAIFSLINGVLLRPPRGVLDPERLVNIYTSDFSSGDFGTSSYPDYEAIRTEAGVFQRVAGYDLRLLSVSVGDETSMLPGAVVTADYFALLGLVPAAGRLLQPADMTPGGPLVAVIRHRFWANRYSGPIPRPWDEPSASTAKP